jgi:PleD family two-component response regulator
LRAFAPLVACQAAQSISTALLLAQVADVALQMAKRGGRNQVVAA